LDKRLIHIYFSIVRYKLFWQYKTLNFKLIRAASVTYFVHLSFNLALA